MKSLASAPIITQILAHRPEDGLAGWYILVRWSGRIPGESARGSPTKAPVPIDKRRFGEPDEVLAVGDAVTERFAVKGIEGNGRQIMRN